MSAPMAMAEQTEEPRPGDPAPDLLTFARGALPLGTGGDSEALRVGQDQLLGAVDGNPRGFVLTPRPAQAGQRVELLFGLPALTRFERFAVPNVLETPSPSQSFVRELQVLGSAESPDAGFQPLAGVTLTEHEQTGERTEFDAQPLPVRWVKLVLIGALDPQRDAMFLEFSELQGYGQQEATPRNEGFTGNWRGRGVRLALEQDGALVVGCYDQGGELNGMVDGRMLYASGINPSDQVRSAFVLTVDETGALSGLRSTNGAPFRPYAGEPTEQRVAECDALDDDTLGCGDTVYGLNFAFDSAELLPGSEPILDALYEGLAGASGQAPQGRVVIEGHTSSEGSEAYNQQLSERRAASVVAALITRGLAPKRISAQGLGESQPIASNDDEAGRALNRRVAVACLD